MHYYGNETIMSLDQVIHLRPNEVRVLEWVRTYEFLENSAGEDDPVQEFLEIKIVEDAAVRVRRNRITEFPEFVTEREELHPDVETALDVFIGWAAALL
ncbi:hypothetical protein JJB07_01040 [Tumebacillus sp. ITR2]|uniref:Uncharacterized protein n=1 Tax=Tumebacillus amylolyticus TaxID=2801339 RepID=A0ABS1J4L6_9BACL|nr:hypothetical protein [Tumebacillus amylolyticus]MBL0385216.1 hypothetical protein [Tumebacillus amylolyticus]